MISRSTNIQSALRSRQRGFFMNPYRFAPAAKPISPTTLDRSTKGSNVNLSADGLQVSMPSNFGSATSIFSADAGKYYFECALYGTARIGVTTNTSNGWIFPGFTGPSWAVSLQRHKVQNNAAQGGTYLGPTGYEGNYPDGTVIGVLLDMDAGTVGFSAFGVYYGVAFAGISGPTYAHVGGSAGSAAVVNFGSSPFSYPVPASFQAGFGAA